MTEPVLEASPSATVEESTQTPTAEPVSTVDPLTLCPTPGTGEKLFVDKQNGFCVLYPENFEQSAYKEFRYDRFQFSGPPPGASAPESVSIGLVVESNGPANGQNSLQYAKKWIDNFGTSAPTGTEEIMLNGQKAVLLKHDAELGTPLQSIFVTANETKYRITLSPRLGTAPELEPGLEAVWNMVTDSIVFFLPQNDQAYIPPEAVCPQASGGYDQYISLTDGYCLLYPTDFEDAADFPGEFLGGPILVEKTAWGDVRASLTVGTAGYFADQTVLDVLNTRIEFIDARSIKETTIAGYPAVVFRDPRGPWASRQAMIMVDGFVYTIVNQPWEPERYPDGMLYLDSIWNTVLTSLAFFDPWR